MWRRELFEVCLQKNGLNPKKLYSLDLSSQSYSAPYYGSNNTQFLSHSCGYLPVVIGNKVIYTIDEQ